MARLEPTLISHDRNDPDRAINMAQSARLRNLEAQGPYPAVKMAGNSKDSCRTPALNCYDRRDVGSMARPWRM
jgi:hypothetical protein